MCTDAHIDYTLPCPSAQLFCSSLHFELYHIPVDSNCDS